MTIHIMIIASDWEMFFAAFLLALGWVLGSMVGSFIRGFVFGTVKVLVEWLEKRERAAV